MNERGAIYKIAEKKSDRLDHVMEYSIEAESRCLEVSAKHFLKLINY